MNTICTSQEAKQYSPLALAFLGDSVYEVMMREHLLLHANMPAGQLHAAKIQKVCAAYQAAAADRIQTILSEEEAAIYRRGRNATGNAIPKHASCSDYRKATGLECLFGYLHVLKRQDRLTAIFQYICETEPQE